MCFEKAHLKCPHEKSKSALSVYKLRYKLFLISPVADHNLQGYVPAFSAYIYTYALTLMYYVL